MTRVGYGFVQDGVLENARVGEHGRWFLAHRSLPL